MSKIRLVRFLKGYRIAVELENGSSFIYDMKTKLSSLRFAPLADQNFFKSGQLIEKEYIKWGDNLILYGYEMLDGMKK